FSQMRKVYDLAVGADGTVYAAGDMGGPTLFISKNGGKNWKRAKRFDGEGSVEALCPLPDGRIALGIERWNALAPGHVYLGSADGTTWQNLDGDLPEGE